MGETVDSIYRRKKPCEVRSKLYDLVLCVLMLNTSKERLYH